ncbi:MAG: hypothetical protein AB8B87_20135 [Granulosicoccus sp.]
MSSGERYEVLVDMRSIGTQSLEVAFDEEELSFSGLLNCLSGRSDSTAALTLNKW